MSCIAIDRMNELDAANHIRANLNNKNAIAKVTQN